MCEAPRNIHSQTTTINDYRYEYPSRRTIKSLLSTARIYKQTGTDSKLPQIITMGDAVITGTNWRLVEVGRVVVIAGNHPLAGRLAAIVEIIDHKRVCYERQPTTQPVRMY